MKTLRRILLPVVAMLTGISLHAQNAYVASSGDMTIEGTSNVHDWEESVQKVTGDGMVTWNTDGSFTISAVNIKVECKAIKSSHGSIMDNKTYEALKADKFPVITYRLTAPVSVAKPGAAGTAVNAKGQLTIAGITKPMDLQVKVFANSDGSIRFEGTKTVKMTDFGVSPPTAFMGAMKVGEDVVLKFKSTMQKKTI